MRINKRSKFIGIENGFRAVSTRTSCYRIRSEQTTEKRKDAPPGQAASGSTDWSDKAVAMAFGLAGAAKRSTEPLGLNGGHGKQLPATSQMLFLTLGFHRVAGDNRRYYFIFHHIQSIQMALLGENVYP